MFENSPISLISVSQAYRFVPQTRSLFIPLIFLIHFTIQSFAVGSFYKFNKAVKSLADLGATYNYNNSNREGGHGHDASNVATEGDDSRHEVDKTTQIESTEGYEI